MSIHSLPTELLRSIVQYLIPYSSASIVGLSHRQYCTRTDFLLSLSLVHPSWTPLAQELLFEEIWIRQKDEGMVGRAGKFLASWRSRGKQYKPKKLRIEGNLGMLLGVTKDEGIWQELEYLEHVNEDSVESLNVYSEFSSLKILSLHARYHCSHALIDRTISLPNLERFELHYPESYENFIYHDGPTNRARPTGLQRFDIPKLKHLTLGVRDEDSVKWIMKNLGSWLRRIEILDIRANLAYDAYEVTILNHPKLFSAKLKHLSIWFKAADRPDNMEFFSWETKGFELETLLLNVEPAPYNGEMQDYIDELFKVVNRLGEIGRGEFEGIKAKRVIYEGDGWRDYALEDWMDYRVESIEQYDHGRERLEWPDRDGIEPVEGQWEDRFEMLKIHEDSDEDADED
ncbi:uncharacterized protein JCM6883_002399 [Sporobolomyces salmoneus]|uniref:uncharacterized protein n=1 Tax=Sporobolomyces salmoneus TaxID=183962 RepID=UPI003171CDDE